MVGTKLGTILRHALFVGTLIKKAKPPSSFPGAALTRGGAGPRKSGFRILHKRLMSEASELTGCHFSVIDADSGCSALQHIAGPGIEPTVNHLVSNTLRVLPGTSHVPLRS